MIDQTHCNGCRNDFYNGPNGLGGKCWSRDKATVVVRFRIHRDTMPEWKGAFTKVSVPDCFRAPPMYFYESLPDFVKPENVRDARMDR